MTLRFSRSLINPAIYSSSSCYTIVLYYKVMLNILAILLIGRRRNVIGTPLPPARLLMFDLDVSRNRSTSSTSFGIPGSPISEIILNLKLDAFLLNVLSQSVLPLACAFPIVSRTRPRIPYLATLSSSSVLSFTSVPPFPIPAQMLRAWSTLSVTISAVTII